MPIMITPADVYNVYLTAVGTIAAVSTMFSIARLYLLVTKES